MLIFRKSFKKSADILKFSEKFIFVLFDKINSPVEKIWESGLGIISLLNPNIFDELIIKKRLKTIIFS